MSNKKNIWIIVAIVLVIAVIFLSNLNKDTYENPNASEEGASMLVPAPGSSNVDEMIVSNDTESTNDGGASMEETSNLSTETHQTKTVVYTDSGFSPEIIQIEVGDTVTFVNNSSRGMWVASNVHPTHTLYPEKTDADCLGSAFDACERTAVGESWSFTFNKKGSWGYHDHVRAGRTGIVEVQ